MISINSELKIGFEEVITIEEDPGCPLKTDINQVVVVMEDNAGIHSLVTFLEPQLANRTSFILWFLKLCLKGFHISPIELAAVLTGYPDILFLLFSNSKVCNFNETVMMRKTL